MNWERSFAEFGFGFDGSDVVAATSQLSPIRASVLQLAATTRIALSDGLDASGIVTIVDAAQPLFEGLRTFHQALAGIALPTLSPQAYSAALESMPEELFDVLLADYLGRNAPIVLHTLAFLDVVRMETIPAEGHPRSRGLAYAMPNYKWDRIGLLFDEPSTWAEQAYGWGVDFQSDSFIRKLAQIFEYMGGFAEIREMSQAQATVFLPHLAASPAPPTFALAPIIKSLATFTSGAGSYAAANELGLAFLPVSGKTDATRRSDSGIAIAPYTEGSIADTIELAPNKQIKLSGNVGVVGGIVFSFRPSGPGIDVGVDTTAFSGAFTAEFIINPTDGQNTIVLIGEPDSNSHRDLRNCFKCWRQRVEYGRRFLRGRGCQAAACCNRRIERRLAGKHFERATGRSGRRSADRLAQQPRYLLRGWNRYQRNDSDG